MRVALLGVLLAIAPASPAPFSTGPVAFPSAPPFAPIASPASKDAHEAVAGFFRELRFRGKAWHVPDRDVWPEFARLAREMQSMDALIERAPFGVAKRFERFERFDWTRAFGLRCELSDFGDEHETIEWYGPGAPAGMRVLRERATSRILATSPLIDVTMESGSLALGGDCRNDVPESIVERFERSSPIAERVAEWYGRTVRVERVDSNDSMKPDGVREELLLLDPATSLPLVLVRLTRDGGWSEGFETTSIDVDVPPRFFVPGGELRDAPNFGAGPEFGFPRTRPTDIEAFTAATARRARLAAMARAEIAASVTVAAAGPAPAVSPGDGATWRQFLAIASKYRSLTMRVRRIEIGTDPAEDGELGTRLAAQNSSTLNTTYDLRWTKPALARCSYRTGDASGGGAIWRGGAYVLAYQGRLGGVVPSGSHSGPIALHRSNPHVAGAYGESCGEDAFERLGARLAGRGMPVESAGPAIDGIATVAERFPGAARSDDPAMEATDRDVLVLDAATSLPIERFAYRNGEVVIFERFDRIRLDAPIDPCAYRDFESCP